MRKILFISIIFLTSCGATVEDVEEAKGEHDIVLVDVWAEGCKPCRMIEPFLKEIEEEYDDIHMLDVDINSNEEMRELYEISRVPTVLIFYKSFEYARLVGFHEKSEYTDILDELLSDVKISTDLNNLVPINKTSSQSCPVE